MGRGAACAMHSPRCRLHSRPQRGAFQSLLTKLSLSACCCFIEGQSLQPTFLQFFLPTSALRPCLRMFSRRSLARNCVLPHSDPYVHRPSSLSRMYLRFVWTSDSFQKQCTCWIVEFEENVLFVVRVAQFRPPLVNGKEIGQD